MASLRSTQRIAGLRFAVPAAAVAVAGLAFAWPADAASIWDGDASGGTKIYGLLNCDSPGSVTAVSDAQRGKIWKYDKPSGSNRCESHGIAVGGSKYAFQNGGTYWFGWSSKLSSTVDNNATFQWKSYGDHIQNWPVVLKTLGGRTTMIQRQPGNQVFTIWSTPATANTWNHYTIGLHLSDESKGGWVELWVNGQQQKFSDGTTRWACRTFDSSNDPKWGVYGAENSRVINYIDDLKVGTARGDVD
ncbi:heparin lyase I family protein [Streptomyces sp. NPDC056697]|uniref:heparin lyase I family protein n=1 Tax=Streptomyces sp. NPDC056697 TaxID=3345915 RepID=UPI0036BF6958